MFGLISKKKIAKIALEIYLENDTGHSAFDKGEERVKDFYYRAGNANALNGLCSHIGINLTEDYVIPAKNAALRKDGACNSRRKLGGRKILPDVRREDG